MSGWLDRWAKRSATAGPVDAPSTEVDRVASAQPASRSRRDFLKKAGIVGGVAWSVPVLQTVMAPAYAASTCPNGTCGVGCNVLCAIGDPCTTGADCITGNCNPSKKCKS